MHALHIPTIQFQVSTYSKAIDTPFSSVRKSDIRVSNPGLAVAPAYGHYGGYASPYVSHVGVAAPFGAPVAKVPKMFL